MDSQSRHRRQLFGVDPATKAHDPAAWQDIIFPDDLDHALENFNKHCADPQHPYDQGIAETLIGILALADKTPPAYVVVPIEKVTPKSIERSYKRVFRRNPPAPLQKEIDRLKAEGVITD